MQQGLRSTRIASAIAAVCLATTAALGFASHAWAAPPPTMPPNVMGPMSGFQYLLGSWSCVGKPKTPASTTKVTYTLASDNTMQFISRSAATSTLGYFGYDAVAKLWWSASVDNDGVRYYQSSKNWQNYTGAMETRDTTFQLQSSMTRITESKYRTVTLEQVDGTWAQTSDVTCVKL